MKTILFGNGLNYFSDHFIAWKDLLDKIKGDNLFANGKLPNTMIYERSIIGNPISFDGLTQNEERIKVSISLMMEKFSTNDFYKSLFEIKAENYLTTNYDYAFLTDIISKGNFQVINKSTEGIYSIRRHKVILENNKVRSNIWNIHGEITVPPSIMLGLDHYCGAVGKIDSYIKGRYEYQIKNYLKRVPSITEKLKTNSFDSSSWLELFFNSDIHIVGLSMDYSEIDLWWILNKRARLKLDSKIRNLINNKIYYYTTSDDEDIFGLLKTLNVEVVKMKLDGSKEEWKKAYTEAIEKIKQS